MSNNIFKRLDHIAVAVENLDAAIEHYQGTLGLELVEKRLTQGTATGMASAVFDAGGFTIVLIQGTDEQSQVSRYVKKYGQGVQHVAFEVENIEKVSHQLAKDGASFSTDIINGNGLRQIFTKRHDSDGMMYELIERTDTRGFQENNINELFAQLEKQGEF